MRGPSAIALALRQDGVNPCRIDCYDSHTAMLVGEPTTAKSRHVTDRLSIGLCAAVVLWVAAPVTACGMNEEGLVANLLYRAESDYGKPVSDRPTLSIGGWAQYVLDSYATVAEAMMELRKEPFMIIAPLLPNGEPNVASTLWRTVHDQKTRVPYFV